MGEGKTVFMVGPGFIGWNILEILVQQGYHVTALVRRDEHAEGIRKSCATPVMGTMDDLSLIEEHAAKSDIVMQVATGDNLPLVNAIFAGARQRADQGKKTIYVHTSGAKVLDDGARGMFKGEKIYTDTDPSGIDSVPDDAPHRDVDMAIVKTQNEMSEHVKVAIMLPPEVYGYDAKHKRLSMLFPNMTRFAIKHGYPPMIGDGLSLETQIHVMDCARGYVTAMHYLESATTEEVLANPYWLVENGKEFSWREAADVVGKALHDRGLIQDPTPKEPPEESWSELAGQRTPQYMGLNCRAKSDRLRALGWEAKEKGIWESYLENELPVILSNIKSK